MLHHQLVVVPAQIVRRLNGHVVQDKGTHYRVDGTDAELMQILGAQLLADPQQPLDILAIRRIPGVLGLRSIVVDASGQSLHGQHAHVVGGQQISQLGGSEEANEGKCYKEPLGNMYSWLLT